ncbi:MAG: DinB family protein [Bacteroidetes bacterium]|nr:MAG: DinB family protein [Bacteroidota bacterium]
MPFQLSEAITTLERTSDVLNHLLKNMPAAWLTSNEGENTFSPYDVVGHLIHGEEADWIPRATLILTKGESQPFEPFDRFAMYTKFKSKSIDELLAMFASAREQSLATLKSWNLTEEQLNLKGTHPALGTVTLKQLLATWVVHDLNHISQITRVISKQYTGEVGAWKEYLSILK